MNSFIQTVTTIRANSAAAWMTAAGVFVAVAGILYGARRLLTRRLAKLTSGTSTCHADGASRTAVFAAGFLAQAMVWSFVVVAAINAFGYDVTALIATLGVGGIAIALAVQNILGDLFAALSIVVDKPFVVGETIDVDGQTGTVERIGLKTTRVRALQGEEVVYSNADLLKARVRNYTRMRERRIVMTISVAAETLSATLARIPGMLREIVLALPNVRFDRAHLAKLANASLDFELVFFSLDPDANVGMDLQQAVYLAVLRRFEVEGVSLAYPTRVIIQRTTGADNAVEVDYAPGDKSGVG